MRRKDREITSYDKMLEIMQSCDCCRIGLKDKDGVYILPLNFGYEEKSGKLTLYFHGASEGKKIDADTLLYIHDNKTAGLIKAALLAGAAIGGADEDSLKNLKKIGYNIGVAFQIKDDILDVTSTTEILGKPVLSDEKNDKVTYVSLYGLEKSQKDFELLSEEAIELLKKIDNSEFLVEYVNKLINRIK